LKLCANVSMLFMEVALLERFAQARAAALVDQMLQALRTKGYGGEDRSALSRMGSSTRARSVVGWLWTCAWRG
jgi:hypothetical protein